MGKWTIRHKDGSLLNDAGGKTVEIHSLEYSGEWMGACNVTCDIESDVPVEFRIGDYIEYRGERFEINYDPGRIKSASRGMKGDGFKYSGVVFNGMVDELVRSEFLDIVLGDNEIHYTTLPKFVFYVSSIDDIADRLQANMNDLYGDGAWHFYTADRKKSVGGRGCDGDVWDEVYGKSAGPTGITSASLSVDNQTCWDVLALVNSQFDVNFVVRGRNVYLETVGFAADHVFQYGKGNGLYQVEESTDSNQAVITRLRGYGNTTNMPTRYYAEVGARVAAKVEAVQDKNEEYCFCRLVLDMPFNIAAFVERRRYKLDSSKDETIDNSYVVKVTFDDETIVKGYIQNRDDYKKCEFYAEPAATGGSDAYDTADEPSKENLLKFIKAIEAGKLLYFTDGVKRSKAPSKNIVYTSDLPNNMAIDRLMLPGFPNESLKTWWERLEKISQGSDEAAEKAKAKIAWLNPTGKELRFSDDKYRPYVESANSDGIGVRPASVYFDTDNEKEGLKDIYPTIEEMLVDGVRIDEIDTGTEESVTDDGVYKDGQAVPNFSIWLKKEIDFDLHTLANDDFAVNMKDGMCGGRSFNVAAVAKNEDGRWQLRLERAKDSSLDLYFPYKDFPIKSGDHMVLTGLDFPEAYVTSASENLLRYTIAKLADNDYTRKTYTPKVDEIFMARQNDEAESDATGKTKSLYKTIKEGDTVWFKDKDLDLDKTITIEKLTIKEQDGKIPTYDVVLKEEKEVGTIQRMQSQISSIVSGASVAGGYTSAQIAGMVAAAGKEYFLSRQGNDTARGLITFLKGLAVGDRYGVTQDGDATLRSLTLGAYGVTQDGDARLNDVEMSTVTLDRAHSTGSTEADRTVIGGQGFDLYMGEDGKSRLYVDYLTARVKAFFAELEVRKVSYSGGTVIYSNAGSTIAKVDVMLGSDGSKVVAYKCYCVADDGTTRTQNWWKPGMMALSETFNVKAGTTENAGNRRYWRLCVGAGQETLQDGKLYDWVMLSNVSEFKGSERVIPTVSEQVIGYEDTAVLMGDVAVSVSSSGMSSLDEVTGYALNDDGIMVRLSTYYGMEDGSDAPLPGDVIVQAGDQIKWDTRGNTVVVRTSSEDGADGSAPSFAMYHGMGKMRDGGVWQWKERTKLDSPELTEVVASRFRFVTDEGERYTLAELKLEQDRFSVSVETLTHKDEELQKEIDTASDAASSAGQSAEEAQRDATKALDDVVAVEKRTSTLEQTSSEISGKVTALSGSYDELSGDVDAVTEQVGELSVKADGISMKVSQAEVRDRNLVPLSYVRLACPLYGAMHRVVRLVKGRKYALSVWGKIDSTLKARGGKLVVYVYRQDSDGTWTWSLPLEITSTETARKVVTFTMDRDTGDCELMAFASPQKDNGGNFYVEKVQLEEIPAEADDGTAWTPYTLDPVAQGGLTPPMGDDGWTKHSSADIEDGGYVADGYTVAVAHAKADTAAVAVMAYAGLRLSVGETYTLSFWVRGTGAVLSMLAPRCCYYAVRDDGAETTSLTGTFSGGWALTDEWQRHWVVFSVKSANPLTLTPVSLQKGGECWLAGVKLEPGGRATDYTPRSVSAAEMLATGIDIYNKRIVVTADQFRIQNNRGEQTFGVDADGNVTMNNIAIGGVINRQGVEVGSDAVAQKIFEVEGDFQTGVYDTAYAVPKLNWLYPIYYVTGTTEVPMALHMPSAAVDDDGTIWGDIWDADGSKSAERLRLIRSMVGNTVTIYNDSEQDVVVDAMSDYFEDIWVSGSSTQQAARAAASGGTSSDKATDGWQEGLGVPTYNGTDSPVNSGAQIYKGKKRDRLRYTLKGGKGMFISLRCVCEVGRYGRESIYWLANQGLGLLT